MSAPEFGDPRLPERFWAKVAVNDDTGCWEWTAARNSRGYGSVKVDGQMRPAHRVAYAAIVGALPAWTPTGAQLDHLCRVRACVNPGHLELVSHRENVLRGESFAAEKSSRTHCPRGHALEGANLVPSQLRARWRSCLTCDRAGKSATYVTIRAACIALGVTHQSYRAMFAHSERTAGRIVAAVESGIAPEVIVANARAAHAAIRKENVDDWLATLRRDGDDGLEVSA